MYAIRSYYAMIEEAAPALNESYLVPHGNIRMEAMGLEDREPTKEELHEMCKVTRRDRITSYNVCYTKLLRKSVGDVVCKIHLKNVWSNEPLRPRRNPNRNGCQADAAGEKRTAGIRGTKNASDDQGAANMYICCLNSLVNPKFI